jgi:hypothetical protein
LEARVIAYKFLRPDRTSLFTDFAWPAPGTWVEASIEPCRSGIHACRVSDLPYWAGHQLYEVELEGDLVEQSTKVVASRARLMRRLEEWEDLRDDYTRMCADRGHELAQSTTPPLDEWEAVIEPSIPEGPALLGFVAARIAEQIAGPPAYRTERARQTDWLAERLGL